MRISDRVNAIIAKQRTDAAKAEADKLDYQRRQQQERHANALQRLEAHTLLQTLFPGTLWNVQRVELNQPYSSGWRIELADIYFRPIDDLEYEFKVDRTGALYWRGNRFSSIEGLAALKRKSDDEHEASMKDPATWL